MPEIKEWHRAIIFTIPGKTGEFVRRRYALKHFKCCGNNLKVGPHARIFTPEKLEVGNDVQISRFAEISAGGNVIIGNEVILSPFVKIWSINHNFEHISTPISQQGWTTAPVVIEDGVWIGMCSIILPGTHIGKGCVIGAGSVLAKKKIEPYSVFVGNPARFVKHRVPPNQTD